MSARALKVAVIAGEVSGDLLGADLIAALKAQSGRDIDLVGVGGEALQAQGLHSLFDFSELSVMGITQVLVRLPRFIRRIGQTAKAIIEARPDLLLIVDSPDFTHRVARKVRAVLPDLAVVNYVCPSVWAWKEYRARQMLAYVDEVLAVLPFEPEAMVRLGGPKTHFVGHRLTTVPELLETRARRAARGAPAPGAIKTIMLLPGSRRAEISSLLPVFGEAVQDFVARNGDTRFVLPTVPRQEKTVREIVATWPIKPELLIGDTAKWRGFAEADAALAASGTVLLELALAGVPVVSAYKTDWLIRLLNFKIRIWTAALPNLIADYPVVPEYFNDSIRAGALSRWMDRLSSDTLQRRAMLEGFDRVWQNLETQSPSGEEGARLVLELLRRKMPGLF
ncbi:lipid-A-disaccharide synthase [Agrobacterium sp. a22-2]|uniref:lipid-A-disaccharide synthase n=1 Tax=Agrobacterium sp. a22-2 TaxID=2283840 RepID=UPI001447216E|nr:lipid-A-disaccharide synthase [Agrobacterium sp. a22-2]